MEDNATTKVKAKEKYAQLQRVLDNTPESSIVSSQAHSTQKDEPEANSHQDDGNHRNGSDGITLSSKSNDLHDDGDPNIRSEHTTPITSVKKPPHTECNIGKYPKSSHLSGAGGSDPNSKSSLKGSIIVSEQSGQPLKPTLPSVSAPNTGDLGQSSIQSQGSIGSLFPSQPPTLTVNKKYSKLNEDVQKVDSTHKVTVCGAKSVGKTTIINQLLANPYGDIKELDQQAKTYGVSVILKNEESKQTMKLNILEVNKHDVTQNKAEAYEHCEVAVIVFDISSYDSLKEADVWIKKIKKHSKGNPVEFLLVGNKDDLHNEMIRRDTQFATRMRISYLKTCTMDELAMDVLLDNLASLAYDQHKGRITTISEINDLKRRDEEKNNEDEKQKELIEEQRKMIEDLKKKNEEKEKEQRKKDEDLNRMMEAQNKKIEILERGSERPWPCQLI